MHHFIAGALGLVALAGMVTIWAISLPIVLAMHGEWLNAAASLLLIPVAIVVNRLLIAIKATLRTKPDEWSFCHLRRGSMRFLINFAYWLGALLGVVMLGATR